MGLRIMSLILSAALAVGSGYVQDGETYDLGHVKGQQNIAEGTNGLDTDAEHKERDGIGAGRKESMESEPHARPEKYNGMEQDSRPENCITEEDMHPFEPEVKKVLPDSVSIPMLYGAQGIHDEKYVANAGYFLSLIHI